jgi:hypothetical protein
VKLPRPPKASGGPCEGERHASSLADLWLFLLLAFGLSWLFALPLWLTGASLGPPMVTVVGLAMMLTPTLGVLAVRLYGRRRGQPGTTWREWAVRTGLSLGERRGRTFALIALAWFGTPLLVVVAIALSAALGLLTVDLGGLSLFRQSLAAVTSGQALPLEPEVLIAVQIASAVLIAPLINSIPAFGEEWGSELPVICSAFLVFPRCFLCDLVGSHHSDRR